MPTTTLLSVAQFRQIAREGGRPDCGVVRAGLAVGGDDARRAIRYCYSDGTIDRYGDTIAAEGWELEAYLANPVALWAHDSCAPPIGKGANLAIESQRLMGDIEFAPVEVYDFADTVYRLCLGGYVKAVSVGFMPLEWSFVSEKDRPYGIDFKRQELLEISACPVPANPNALQEAKSAGISLEPLRQWAERVLDGEGLAALPLAEIDALRRQAEGSKRHYSLASAGAVSRAGRVLSAENEATLRQAAENAETIGDLIESVLSQVDPETPPDTDDDPAAAAAQAAAAAASAAASDAQEQRRRLAEIERLRLED
jgi:HK97 family phage prohead protease